jgi:23S rRNA (pseudouridine1915-N3)-methyltransferase
MKIICLGKLDPNYNSLINELAKQIHFLEIVELKDYKSAQYLEKEGQMILSNTTSKDFVITLEIEGQMLTTLEFVDYIDENISKNLVFVIGSSFGLSQEVKNRSNYRLSLSKNTFSHAIARLLLVEQLYRYVTIKKNHPYHK